MLVDVNTGTRACSHEVKRKGLFCNDRGYAHDMVLFLHCEPGPHSWELSISPSGGKVYYRRVAMSYVLEAQAIKIAINIYLYNKTSRNLTSRVMPSRLSSPS